MRSTLFAIKFLFDRVTALFGLLLLLPVFLVIAMLIRLKMPDGPVFFVQERIGRHGKPFKIHKFRTMITKHNGSTVSVAGENRITSLGAKLRHYKLDELPELWDVLVGKMSFVGPRPDVKGYADLLQGNDRKILELRPGITGPSSLKYRNEEQLLSQQSDPQKYNDEVIYPDKVRINLYYYEHFSLINDLRLIFATVFNKHIYYNNEII